MLRIIVTVRLAEDGLPIDVEVPAELPCARLAARLANTLGETTSLASANMEFALSVFPAGQILPGQATLADAGIWDGATLLLKRVETAYFESDQGAQYAVPANAFWIGRRSAGRTTADADTVLLDLSEEPQSATISRRHAQVERRADVWFLRPAHEARNPVSVNARMPAPSEETALHHGDEIQFGHVRLRFRLSAGQH